MKAMDLSGLIKGLMVLIGIALALGKLEALKKWACLELTSQKNNRPTQVR